MIGTIKIIKDKELQTIILNDRGTFENNVRGLLQNNNLSIELVQIIYPGIDYVDAEEKAKKAATKKTIKNKILKNYKKLEINIEINKDVDIKDNIKKNNKKLEDKNTDDKVYNIKINDIEKIILKKEQNDKYLLVTIDKKYLKYSNLEKIRNYYKDFDVDFDVIMSEGEKVVRIESIDDNNDDTISVKEFAFLKSENPELEKLAHRSFNNTYFVKVRGNNDLIRKINSCYNENANIILEIR